MKTFDDCQKLGTQLGIPPADIAEVYGISVPLAYLEDLRNNSRIELRAAKTQEERLSIYRRLPTKTALSTAVIDALCKHADKE